MSAVGSGVKIINDLVSFIFGILLTYVAVKWSTYRMFSPAVLIMLTVTGYMSIAVTIFNGVLDCIVILCENEKLSYVKAAISMVLILTLISTGIASIILVDRDFEMDVMDAMVAYSVNATEERIWDHVHQDFECCGLSNYTDWLGLGDFDNFTLPDSCCFLFYPGCGKNIIPDLEARLETDSTIYTRSCVDAGFFSYFYPWTYAVAGISLFINVMNVIAVIASGDEGEAFEM